MPVSAYIFDIGGVLLDFDLRGIARTLAGTSALRTNKLLALRDDASLREVETGRMNGFAYHRDVVKPIVPESTYRGLVCAWRDVFTINRAGYSLFTDLHKAGRSVYVLSNLSDYTLEAIQEKFPDLLKHSEGNFFSYLIGAVKPEPAAYLKVCETTVTKPEECIFLDDTAECVEGAKHVGMQGMLFSRDCIKEIRLACGARSGGK